MNLRFPIIAAVCLFTYPLFAQQGSPSATKFGKISVADFRQGTYSIDTNANAITIADIGSTRFVVNKKNNFSLEFNKFRRMHIINKKGYDAASIEIPIYTHGHLEEQVKNLKAVTYNLEDGKIIETKLDTKEAVFKEKLNKKWTIQKFIFPNVKEGSIIEYQYELRSDFIFNLQPWNFQGDYPCLWSEYTVSMPEFYKYLSLTQGYQHYFLKDQKDKMSTFRIIEENGMQSNNIITIDAGVTDFHWVMKDVPALVPESYTSTTKNYISRIEFQLAGYAEPLIPKSVLGNWNEASAELLKADDFGGTLNKNNGWLGDVLSQSTMGATNDLDKARKIFIYLRDYMTCTNYYNMYLERSLKDVLKARSGNVGEINLLLTAMLLKAGLDAKPVILSTRSHGHAYSQYPLIDRFNYVITRLMINDHEYLLDASHPMLAFGNLQYDAYNGEARIITDPSIPINLVSDSLKENKLTTFNVGMDEKGNWAGSMKQTPGPYESYTMRNYIKTSGKAQLASDQKKGFNSEIEIQNLGVDQMEKYEEPLSIHYDFTIKGSQADLIYLNPMFSEAIKENPFKSPTRTYPVEMPYCIDETYLLKLDVPKGYTIDELPKPLMVKLNDNEESFFEYALSESGGIISLRSRICLKRCNFLTSEYSVLREFYNMIVKKQNEQIVLKKKA
ncbi:MAG: DUF3857 domain-containing protein [Ferruginibacter sp.]